jgi:hypothetical protein
MLFLLTIQQQSPDPLGDGDDNGFGPWIEAGINDFLKLFAGELPGLLLAIIVVGLFHVFGGRLADRITRFLRETEFGEAVADTPLGAAFDSDEEFFPRIIGRFVYYYLLLLGLSIGAAYLPLQNLPARLGGLLGYFQSLFTALLVLVVGFALVKAISNHIADKEELEGTQLGALTQAIVEVLFYLLVIVFSASLVGAGVGGVLQFVAIALLVAVLAAAVIFGMGDRDPGDVLG